MNSQYFPFVLTLILLFMTPTTPNVIISDQRFRRKFDSKVIIGIIPDKELGYVKSLKHLKNQGHDINLYGCLKTMESNVPKLYQYVTS